MIIAFVLNFQNVIYFSLQCIPNSCLCNNTNENVGKVCAENQSSIDFQKLQKRFMEVQQKKKTFTNSVFKNF